MKIFEIHLFGFQIAPTYYGLMYALGFLYGLWAIKKTKKYNSSQIDSLFLYIFAGVVLGGRIGYVLFYNFSKFLENPISLVKVWEGGMSFHGGFLGVCLALYLYARKERISLWSLSDDIAKIIPVGLFFGRIGNYLNKELLGFSYNGPLAIKTTQGSFFPSPLVEAFLEGAVIFVLLNFVHKVSSSGKFAALFLIYYGVFRTFVELCIRTPDSHIGYYFGFFTQGSFLSIPMIIIGVVLYGRFKRGA